MKEQLDRVFWVLMLVGVLTIYTKIKEINEKARNTKVLTERTK